MQQRLASYPCYIFIRFSEHYPDRNIIWTVVFQWLAQYTFVWNVGKLGKTLKIYSLIFYGIIKTWSSVLFLWKILIVIAILK